MPVTTVGVFLIGFVVGGILSLLACGVLAVVLLPKFALKLAPQIRKALK